MDTASIHDVSVALPTLHEVIQVLTFRGGFNTSLVLIGTSFLGIAAGVVGTFSLLRKRALVSDALAHSALPGIAIAFLILPTFGISGRSLPWLLTGAACSGVLGVLVIQFLVRSTRLTEDASIGAVLSVFFGIGIVLLSYIQSLGRGGEGGLHHFIYGQTAALNQADAVTTCLLAGLALAVAALFLKEFRLVCFDPAFAGAQGWPVGAIDLIMMSLVVLVTVVGLQSVGLILVVALLIIPATAAKFWTERLTRMTLLAAVFGGLSGYCGGAASALLARLPAGAVIVVTSGIFFVFSFFFAPKRGLVASVFRLCRLRARISEEHLLRSSYEYLERSGAIDRNEREVPLSEIGVWRGATPLFRTPLVWLCRLQGLFSKISAQAVTLSEQGFTKAAKFTRSHRLWEEYLVSQIGMSVSHVDYSADFAEHALSRDVLESLERSLAAKGDLPPLDRTPGSVHPVDGEFK